jgi:ATP phosphoribosyltransferase
VKKTLKNGSVREKTARTGGYENMITVALAKGRLADKTMEILAACGYDCAALLAEKTRKLVLAEPSGALRFIFVKPSDVPVYVEYGVADIGVCGSDTLLEADAGIYELLDLKFGKCRLCIAGYPDYAARRGDTLRVATKYANITGNYYHNKGENVKIIRLNGSVELGPVMGLSDLILDIVESGSTLRDNGLSVLHEICAVSARLVCNKVSLKIKSEEIKPLVAKIKSAL